MKTFAVHAEDSHSRSLRLTKREKTGSNFFSHNDRINNLRL